ncbi:fimbrial protein [Serratia marcescens]|uniref:fimbrial protein n=1 Tax=Serratia marcescens TaxID=615 RepID=UPI0039EBB6F6
MKNIIKGLLLVGYGLSFCAHGADGSVDLELKLVNDTCNLTSDSKNMQVLLGDVSRTELKSIGAASKPVEFTIKVTDCAPDIRVDFNIHGNAANRHKERRNTFELDSDSVASGVGVQVAVDGGEWESEYAFVGRANADGAISKVFKARYIALDDKIIPGRANAAVQFNLIYP